MKDKDIKQKIIIIRRGGTYLIKGNGDAYLMELATGAFKRGEMQPTFFQKLRRFLRRLRLTIDHCFSEAWEIATSTETPAGDVPYIGLLEDKI